MWRPQWAARASGRGTPVVVLVRVVPFGANAWISHLFSIVCASIQSLKEEQKALAGTIYAAEKPTKMTRKPHNENSQCFQPEPEDRKSPF